MLYNGDINIFRVSFTRGSYTFANHSQNFAAIILIYHATLCQFSVVFTVSRFLINLLGILSQYLELLPLFYIPCRIFQSTFESLTFDVTRFDCSYISDVSVTLSVDKVVTAPKHASKNAGLDGILVSVYQKYAQQLAGIVCYIFNQNIHSEMVPKIFKVEKVIPIPKKQYSHQIAHFCPISLLNHLAKILETFVLKKLSIPFSNHSQFPFFPFKKNVTGTTIAATLVYDSIIRFVHNPGMVNLPMVDFKEAFDKAFSAMILCQNQVYHGKKYTG